MDYEEQQRQQQAQEVNHYGVTPFHGTQKRFTRAQVEHLTTLLNYATVYSHGVKRNDGNRGVRSGKHYADGYRAAMTHMASALLQGLFAEGQPMEDQAQRWSASGKDNAARITLRKLQDAIDSGVWPQ
jgi:hypothetical protein